MRSCFLHIGTHKTGTSTLQRVLAEHPQELAAAGFYFPQTGRITADSGQHALAALAPSDQHDALMSALLTEVASCEVDNIIVSSEEFSRMLWHNPDGFQTVVSQLNTAFERLIVVIYLRRQSDFIESNYIERLKSRLCLDFASYARARLQQDLAEFPLDYAQWIERLENMRGFELCVRSYDAVRATSTLHDFQQIIDWPDEIVLPDGRDNTSSDLVEALKQFCRAQERRDLSRAEEWVIELIASGFKGRPPMDRATRRAIVSRFHASNLELAKRFDVQHLVEEVPQDREFGAWQGLDGSPPPDWAAMPDATLDQLFSRSFSVMVATIGERVAALNVALAEVQTLTRSRQDEIERLRSRVTELEARIHPELHKATAPKLTSTKIRSVWANMRHSSTVSRWRKLVMFLVVILTALLPTLMTGAEATDAVSNDVGHDRRN